MSRWSKLQRFEFFCLFLIILCPGKLEAQVPSQVQSSLEPEDLKISPHLTSLLAAHTLPRPPQVGGTRAATGTHVTFPQALAK